jgi:prenyl protein peptidase
MWLAHTFSQTGWDTTAVHLGFTLRKFSLPAHFVTPALFLGPLYGRYLGQDLPFMAYWTFANNGPLFSWVRIRNHVVVSASPLNALKASNCEWECSGAHIRRTGLALMPSLCLPPRWCLKHIPGILHASVIRMWCVPLILTRCYKFEHMPAHLHHVWEIYNMHGRTAQALRRAIFSIRKESPNR